MTLLTILHSTPLHVASWAAGGYLVKRKKRITRRKIKLPAPVEEVRKEVEQETGKEVGTYVTAKVTKAVSELWAKPQDEQAERALLEELRNTLMFLAMRQELLIVIELQRSRQALLAALKRLQEIEDEEALILLLLS